MVLMKTYLGEDIYDVRKEGGWLTFKKLLQNADVCRCQRGVDDEGWSDRMHVNIHDIFSLSFSNEYN